MKKVVDQDGTIVYYNDRGEYHRDDGPALEYTNGTKFWFKNNKSHRLNGPATEWADGMVRYYINSVRLTEEEYWRHPEVLLHWIVNLPEEQ